jgi:hypothetical protein
VLGGQVFDSADQLTRHSLVGASDLDPLKVAEWVSGQYSIVVVARARTRFTFARSRAFLPYMQRRPARDAAPQHRRALSDRS